MTGTRPATMATLYMTWNDMIAAMPALRERHPGLRLVVAGDGPYRPTLRQLAHDLAVDRAVSFAGFLGGDLAATMAATDAMVVPSIYEPFGMVALEAMQRGAIGSIVVLAQLACLLDLKP